MLGDPIGSLCRKCVIKTLLFVPVGTFLFLDNRLAGYHGDSSLVLMLSAVLTAPALILMPWRSSSWQPQDPRAEALRSRTCFFFAARGRKSPLMNVFLQFFCCGGSRPLTPLPRPSAASRHFNSASAGISCFDEGSEEEPS